MKIKTVLKSVLIAGVVGLSGVAHAQQWTLTAQTYAGFDVKSMGFSIVKGRFDHFQSSMYFDPDTLQNSSARLVLEINSLGLNKPGLKEMVLGEDFFFVAQYPTATFNSREFIAVGDHQYRIEGDLTLRGMTKPVTLKASLKPNTDNPQLLDVEAKTVVHRSDFGMKKAFAGIGEKVMIEVSGQWRAQ